MRPDPQYVDEFKRIAFANGTIRIELGVLPVVDEGQQPVLETRGTLVMSVEGFIRGAATIEAFVKQLAAKGIIRRDPLPLGQIDPRTPK